MEKLLTFHGDLAQPFTDGHGRASALDEAKVRPLRFVFFDLFFDLFQSLSRFGQFLS